MNNGSDSAGKRFAGKTIPDFFGSLPSLEGLFLGEFIFWVLLINVIKMIIIDVIDDYNNVE